MFCDQMVESGIIWLYCQKSEIFYCGVRRRVGEIGVVRCVSFGFICGYFVLLGNQYWLVFYDIYGMVVGYIFWVGDWVVFQLWFN